MRDTPKDIEDAPVYGREGSPQPPAQGDILDPAFARRLGREIWESSTNWINAGKRAKWNDSLRAFQGLHPSGSKYLSGDYKYRSRLFRPKTRAMVRKAEASTAQAFFANEDVVSITAQNDDDPAQQASAEILKQLLQYRLTSTIPWFLTLVGARQDAEVMGICIGKAYWKYAERLSESIQRVKTDEFGPVMENDAPVMEQYDVYTKTQDHPWVDLIASENFRFDPGADWRNPIATSPYTIELHAMYVCDVMDKIETGDWLPVSEGSIRGAVDLDDDATRRSREQGRVPGKDADAWKPKDFDICWIRENIVRHKGKDWHFFSISSGGELLTKPRPLEEVYLHGMRPYVVGFILPEAHKVYPTSKAELIKDLQTQVNDVTNLRLDNVKLALNPRQFVAAGQGVDPNDIRSFNPGKVTILSGKMTPGDAILWDRPPEVTGSSFQEHDRLNMDLDELVGGTSNSSLQANPQAYKTVGNMELMDGNASVLEEYDQRVFAETFVEPLINQLIKLEQAYETDETVLTLAGQKAQLFQKFGVSEITDELLKQELTVRVNVGLGATNPQKKLQNFLTAGTAIGQMFGPAAAMGAKFDETVKEVFSLCGYKDGARFFEKDFDIRQAQQQLGQKQDKGIPPEQQMQLEQAKLQGQMQLEKSKQQAQAQQNAISQSFEMSNTEKEMKLEMQKIELEYRLKWWQAQQEARLEEELQKEKLSMDARFKEKQLKQQSKEPDNG